VFLRDRQAGTTSRVSVSSAGTQANAYSSTVALSADGRYVAFSSSASNLVTGDTNAYEDVFVRDLTADTTTRVSVSSGGVQANGLSTRPAISGDGRYVVFHSDAYNLVPNDFSFQDIFLHDRPRHDHPSQHRQRRIGAQRQQHYAVISGDGRFVVFQSWSSNLVADDTNGLADVFVYDRQSGVMERIESRLSSERGRSWP